MNYNNLNPDASLLRDTFLKAEKDYVLYLIHNSEEVRSLIVELNETFTSESLFKLAEELVSDVDNGLVPDEKMGETEIKLIVLLAALKDKTLIRELILVQDQQKGMGMHK